MTHSDGAAESFLERFSACAGASPDATALVDGTKRLSFGELDSRSTRLARRLCELGVDTETCAAIYLRRGADVILSMLAILKARGFFLVLSPTDPTDRLAWILDDAQAVVVITEAALAERLPAHWGYNLDLALEDSAVQARSDEPLRTCECNSAAAYIVYTSGSTGKPKAVITPRSSFDSRIVALRSLLNLDAGSAQLHLLNFSFDGSYSEIFPVLSGGGKLVVSPGAPLPAAPLVELLRSERITTFTLTPSYWHSLMRDLEICGLRIPESVRSIQVGGDRIAVANLERWCRFTKGPVRFVNLYGPTEATIVATAYDAVNLTGDEEWLPIGTPLTRSFAYVLGDDCQPVAPCEIGELYLSGDGLARGYLHFPDLTAKLFVPDSISQVPGMRMYRTGDRARYDANGVLHFTGRADDQLKLRGYRVEPAEIESLLASHPSVAQAAVVARPGGLGELRLTAFAVAADGAAADPEDLRAYLSSKASRHMEVDRVIVVDALPVNPNGKLDRNALAELAAREQPTVIRRAPRTYREAVLKRIWRQVLGIEVAMTDNFLDLGGDSLTATQISARATAILETTLRVEDVFQYPTIEALAERIGTLHTCAIRNVSAGESLEQTLLRSSTARHVVAIPVADCESPPRFERAVRAMTERHEILASPNAMNWAEEGRFFVMRFHPAVCDRWSAEVIRREILAFEEWVRNAGLPPLASPAMQYSSYAARYGVGVRSGLTITQPVATCAWSELPEAVAASVLDAREGGAMRIPALALQQLLTSDEREHSPVIVLDSRRRDPAIEDMVGPVFRVSRLDGPDELTEIADPTTLFDDLSRARADGELLTAVWRSYSAETPGIEDSGESRWADVPLVFDLVTAILEEPGGCRWALRSYSSKFPAEGLARVAEAYRRIAIELVEGISRGA